MIFSKLASVFCGGIRPHEGIADPTGDLALERRRLEALEGTGLLDGAPPPEIEAICQAAKVEFGTSIAMVNLVGQDRLVVTAQAGCQLREAPRSVAFCDHTIRTDEVFVVPDMARDIRFADNPFVRGEPFVRFYAGAPLLYLRNVRLGALCLIDPAPRDFLPAQQERLARLAAEIADIILTQEVDRKAAALFALRPAPRAPARSLHVPCNRLTV